MRQSQLRLDDVLSFGKHKGCEVEDLLDDDPRWLAWIYEQDNDIFDCEVIAEMEKRKII